MGLSGTRGLSTSRHTGRTCDLTSGKSCQEPARSYSQAPYTGRGHRICCPPYARSGSAQNCRSTYEGEPERGDCCSGPCTCISSRPSGRLSQADLEAVSARSSTACATVTHCRKWCHQHLPSGFREGSLCQLATQFSPTLSVQCALGQLCVLRRRELSISVAMPQLALGLTPASPVMPELVVLSLSCDVRSGQSWSNRDEASDGFPDLCCWPARSAVRRRSKGDRCYVVQVYSVYSSVRCALGQRRSQVSHRSSWLRRRELTMSLAAPRLTLSSSVRPELSLLRVLFCASGGPLRGSN